MPTNKINPRTETKIVKWMAHGMPYKDILERLEEENSLKINMQTLTNIKKRNYDKLDQFREAIIKEEAATASVLHQRSNKMLQKKLDKADQDTDYLQELKQKYVDGEIDIKEFNQQVEKLEEVSIDQLLKISKEMHSQTSGSSENSSGGGGNTVDPHQAKDLVHALQNSDAVELQRIVFSSQSQE